MHWLEKWRNKYGMSREQLAAMCKPVTEGVIIRIEEGWGYGVTHPDFAKLICDYVGATAKQWDSIVPRKYRGTYTPQKRDRLKDFKPVKPEKPKEPYKPKNISLRGGNRRKKVLQIGLDCEIMKSYPSVDEAAEALGKSKGFIASRAKAEVDFNEFQPLGFTFRFASDWNETAKAMLMPIAKEAAMLRRQGVKNIRGRYLTIDGETHCLKEWAVIAGIDATTLRNRLDKMGMEPKEAVFAPLFKKHTKGGRK